MVETEFNLFDAAVILIILLSSILAFFRGFVREFLSLGAWIAAAVITVYVYEDVAAMLRPHTSSDTVSYLLAGAGTYITLLLTLSIINAVIVRYVKSGDEVGMFDNFLGLLFGFLRGGFIVSLGYVVMSLIIDHENPPIWIKQAVTLPAVQQGALWLAQISPEYLEEISSLSGEIQGQLEGDSTLDFGDSIEIPSSDEIKEMLGNDKGYSEEERKLLEKLMKGQK